MAGNRVVIAGEVDRPAGEERLHHADRLLESRHAVARRVERDSRLLVVGSHPPGAEPDLDATAREPVERQELLREHQRMPVVVGEHEAADAQRLGRARGRGHRDDRRELLVEVVAQQERGEAQRLVPARGRGPRVAGRRIGSVYTESERSIAHASPGWREPIDAPTAFGTTDRDDPTAAARDEEVRPPAGARDPGLHDGVTRAGVEVNGV